MRKVIFLLFIAAVALGAVSKSRGGDDASRKQIVEEIVAIVGNNNISLSDLFMTTQQLIEFRKQYGVSSELQPAEEALEMLLQQKLLVTQARIDSLDTELRPVDTDVDNRIQELIKQHGSMGELEKSVGKAIFQIREDLKQEIMKKNLAQYMEYTLRSKVKISHKEVAEFYKTLNLDSLPPMPPQIAFAQIVKKPPTSEERKYEVRQRLLEFRERIVKGEKMEVLARLYSHDPSKLNGGEFSSAFSDVVGPFAEAVRQLQPGQISEIVETEYGFHIIELVSKTESNFVVRHILLRPEFTVEEEIAASKELDSIANEIKVGNVTFAQAALENSDDAETKMNGGQSFNISSYYNSGQNLREMSKFYFYDQLMPVDGRVLGKMEVGDISEPFQSIDSRGNIVYKIITVTDKRPSHPVNLEEDFVVIEDLALNKKQEEYMNSWMEKQISKTFVWINPAYIDYNFENKAWKKRAEELANRDADERITSNTL